MMTDVGSAGGAGAGYDERLGDKPMTMTGVLKEFQGLKDKFKNEDEDDCESDELALPFPFLPLPCLAVCSRPGYVWVVSRLSVGSRAVCLMSRVYIMVFQQSV